MSYFFDVIFSYLFNFIFKVTYFAVRGSTVPIIIINVEIYL